jgi:hypothetical protein
MLVGGSWLTTISSMIKKLECPGVVSIITFAGKLDMPYELL